MTTDEHVLALVDETQALKDVQRQDAGQRIGVGALILWTYASLASLAGESERSAQRRALRLVDAGALERIPGRVALFRRAGHPHAVKSLRRNVR